jgi:hypothetical protein
MIFKSKSDDTTGTNGAFTMTDGSLTAAVGPLFYVTNSTGNINLTGVSVTVPSGILIQAAAAQCGASGCNGGKAIFTADRQTLTSDLVCDSISSITATLKNKSSLTGAINTAALTLDATSTWSVTGDSYLTGLTDDDPTFANIDDNGHTIYYDSSLSANSWLGGDTYYLTDGGKITPGMTAKSALASAPPSLVGSASPATKCLSGSWGSWWSTRSSATNSSND